MKVQSYYKVYTQCLPSSNLKILLSCNIKEKNILDYMNYKTIYRKMQTGVNRKRVAAA